MVAVVMADALEDGADQVAHVAESAATDVSVAAVRSYRAARERGSKRVEFRIKMSSEVTWMKAARSGLIMPAAASAIPTASTVSVP